MQVCTLVRSDRVPRHVGNERLRQEQLPVGGGLPAPGLGHLLGQPREGPAAARTRLAAPAAPDLHHGQHGPHARRPGHGDQLEFRLLQDLARHPKARRIGKIVVGRTLQFVPDVFVEQVDMVIPHYDDIVHI